MNFLDELNNFADIVHSRRNRRVKIIKRIPGNIRGDDERHLRLSEENKRTLVEEFHTWRGCGRTSSEKRVEFFFEFRNRWRFLSPDWPCFRTCQNSCYQENQEKEENKKIRT